MRNSKSLLHFAVGCLLLLSLILGCSSEGNIPTQPPIDGDGTPSISLPDQSVTPPVDPDEVVREAGGARIMPWGIFDVTWDRTTNEIRVVPLRSAETTWNVLRFLQPPTGDAINLDVTVTDGSLFHTEGRLAVDVTITHPFATPVLTGFDVLGVVIGNGTILSTEDPGVAYAGDNDLRLINADGYTRWMNPSEFTQSGVLGFTEGNFGTKNAGFTATVNGYKYFASGITSTQTVEDFFSVPANVENRGAFLPYGAVTRSYVLQFPMVGGEPEVRFQYAVLAHWNRAKDANGDPIPDPGIDDFPLTVNMAEAVHVVCDASGSTAWYEDESNRGGDLILDIFIYDWQGELTAEGVVDQIGELIVEAPSGMITGGVMSFSTLDLLSAQTSSGPNFAQILLEIPNVLPTGPDEETLLIVRSADPNNYDSGFGAPYPEDAQLAAYSRAIIPILDHAPNQSPVIDEMTGNTAVNCFIGEEDYTVVAHDPDVGDILTYKWEVTPDGVPPTYADPLSTIDTCTVDWADNDTYPFGEWDVWVQVCDGSTEVSDHLDVTKSDEQLIAGMINADPSHIDSVICNEIGEYVADANDCEPDEPLEYRFIRKCTTDDTPPDAADPDWTEWKSDDTWTVGWEDTEVGDWRMWAHVREANHPGIEDVSPALAITRVNMLGQPSAPDGELDVDCEDTECEYYAGGVVDCDADQTHTRAWAVSTEMDPPTSGWTVFTGDSFVVNWDGYTAGIYYLWQNITDGVANETSPPRTVVKYNTAPTVPAPSGLVYVDCETDAEYTCEIEDCDSGDELQKQYYLSSDPVTPTDGSWTDFTGNTFMIDFGPVASGYWWIFTRADDGSGWIQCLNPLEVTKINTPPEVGTISGPTSVQCTDPEPYTVSIDDCDGEIPDTWWSVYSTIDPPPFPSSDWHAFSITPFVVDYAPMPNGSLHMVVKAEDAESQTDSPVLDITKLNTPPELTQAPSGDQEVICGGEREYEVGSVLDCDSDQTLSRAWIVHDADELPPPGADWHSFPVDDTTITVNWDGYDDGTYFLCQKCSDGTETDWNNLEIRLESSALSVTTPDGEDDVTCSNTASPYTVDIEYCDEPPSRSWGASMTNDPGTVTDWYEFFDEVFEVDWSDFSNGPSGDVHYYLFARVSNIEGTSYSDPPLDVLRRNTVPYVGTPAGPSIVTCVTPYEFDFGPVADCDRDDIITRWFAMGCSITVPPSAPEEWIPFTGTTGMVDFTGRDLGTYFVWQKASDGFAYYICTPSKQVTMVNTPPSIPAIISGPMNVDCEDGDSFIYGTTSFGDCDHNQIRQRRWGVCTTGDYGDVSEWLPFATSNTFEVPIEDLEFGTNMLFVRDYDGFEYAYSDYWTVTLENLPPSTPITPDGEISIDLNSGTVYTYDVGLVDDCGPNQELTRAWSVGDNPSEPNGTWNSFPWSQTSIDVDWSDFGPGTWYLWQRAGDGIETVVSSPLEVIVQD